MGSQSSSDNLGALPTQQVVSLGAGSHSNAVQSQARAQAAAMVAPAEHVAPTQAKCWAFWDKSSFRVARAGSANSLIGTSKSLWQFFGDFAAEDHCELTVQFHCRERLNGAHLQHVPVEQGGPPGFTLRYQPGKHTFCLDGDKAIDLKRWPLNVFWKFKRDDVVPIVLCLVARGVQLVTHFSLQLEGNQLNPLMLKQNVVINGYQYPMQEVYGLAELGSKDHDNEDAQQPCVVCLTDPRNTVVLPCQHLCCCEECAAQLQIGAKMRGDKCPICRHDIDGVRVFDAVK
jgi:hypothetical protein